MAGRYDVHIHTGEQRTGVKIGKNTVTALFVAMITVLLPLMAGAAVGITIFLEGERLYALTPDDANGFLVVNSSTTNGGICTSWATTPSTTVISKWSTNFTKVNAPSSTTCPYNYSDDNYINIRAPNLAFPDPANYTFSTFSLVVWREASYHTYSMPVDYCDLDFKLLVNGSEVVNSFGACTKTFKYDSGTSGNKRSYLNTSWRLGALEEIRYRNAAGPCWPNCTIVMNISDWNYLASDGTSYYSSTVPFTDDFGIAIYSRETNIDTTSVMIKIMAVSLGVFNCLVALAATSYWNPFMALVSKKGTSISATGGGLFG